MKINTVHHKKMRIFLTPKGGFVHKFRKGIRIWYYTYPDLHCSTSYDIIRFIRLMNDLKMIYRPGTEG